MDDDEDHPFVHSTFEFTYDADRDIARYAEARDAALALVVPGDERSLRAFREADCMWRCALDVVDSREYRAHARIVAQRRDMQAWQGRLVSEATAALAAAGGGGELGRRVPLRALRRRMNVGLNRLALIRLEPVAVQQEEEEALLGRFLAYMDGATLEEALVLVAPGAARVVPTRRLFVFAAAATAPP